MIEFEGFNGAGIEIIREQAMETSLTKAFGDAASACKKVDCFKMIHGSTELV
jgi:hypothetical protein